MDCPRCWLGQGSFLPAESLGPSHILYYDDIVFHSKVKESKKNRVSWRVEKLSTNSARRVGTP